MQAECFRLGVEYTGEESGSKIARVRAELEKEAELEGVIVSSLDQIACQYSRSLDSTKWICADPSVCVFQGC